MRSVFKTNSVIVIFLGCFSLIYVIANVFLQNEPEYVHRTTERSLTRVNRDAYLFPTDSCKTFLTNLSTKFVGIVIDVDFLEKLSKNKTDCAVSSLKVAVLGSEIGNYIEARNKNITIELVPYFNDSNKDFWIFNDNGIRRAVPRISLHNVSGFYYPANVELFLKYWQSSRIIQCLNLNMNRTRSEHNIPIPESFAQMALLRNLLTSYGMFPFLFSGSLLGWYRECSIIPHTKDIDFAVFIEQFNPQFEIDVLSGKTDFTMKRRLGMLNDSFEYTLHPTNNHKVIIDIFFAYKSLNGYWLGSTADNGDKFRYNYPSFDVRCAADLGGHLFWVPCEPEKLLEADYGKGWRRDHPTSEYKWDKSGKNAMKVGKWQQENLDLVVVYYQRSFFEALFAWFASRFYNLH